MGDVIDRKRAAARVAAVLAICRRPGRILILLQDNPDPDALASAAALRELLHVHLKKRAVIGYGGICGRPENRAMMSALRIDARHVTPPQLSQFDIICLVDTQPRTGNNILMSSRPAQVVIDHHLVPKRRPWVAEFADIRPDYGAASTLLYEYVLAGGIKLTPLLATALFYGIQSDTQDLGREATSADIQAYRDLFLVADKKKLSKIHLAPVPADYFRMLADSLSDAIIAGTTVVSFVENCSNVDMIAEVADRLMRIEGIRTAVCYGVYDDTVHLSARAVDARSNAALRIRRVVRQLGYGGGHRVMAGGRIPLGDDPARRLELVRERILKVFAPDKTPVTLSDWRPEARRRTRRT